MDEDEMNVKSPRWEEEMKEGDSDADDARAGPSPSLKKLDVCAWLTARR